MKTMAAEAIAAKTQKDISGILEVITRIRKNNFIPF